MLRVTNLKYVLNTYYCRLESQKPMLCHTKAVNKLIPPVPWKVICSSREMVENFRMLRFAGCFLPLSTKSYMSQKDLDRGGSVQAEMGVGVLGEALFAYWLQPKLKRFSG